MKRLILIALCLTIGIYLMKSAGLSIQFSDNKKVEINTIIDPEFTQIGNYSVAVEYMLGDLLVLDGWYNLNSAQVLFLADKNKKKQIKLHVKMGDMGSSSNGFRYSIGNIEVKTDPISWELFEKHIDSMPDLVWVVNKEKSTPEIKSSKDKPTGKTL